MSWRMKSAYNEKSNIQAADVVARLIENLQISKIKHRVVEINVDVDIDGNISETPTGITLRVIVQ